MYRKWPFHPHLLCGQEAEGQNACKSQVGEDIYFQTARTVPRCPFAQYLMQSAVRHRGHTKTDEPEKRWILAYHGCERCLLDSKFERNPIGNAWGEKGTTKGAGPRQETWETRSILHLKKGFVCPRRWTKQTKPPMNSHTRALGHTPHRPKVSSKSLCAVQSQQRQHAKRPKMNLPRLPEKILR